jgi:hypothetical protein
MLSYSRNTIIEVDIYIFKWYCCENWIYFANVNIVTYHDTQTNLSCVLMYARWHIISSLFHFVNIMFILHCLISQTKYKTYLLLWPLQSYEALPTRQKWKKCWIKCCISLKAMEIVKMLRCVNLSYLS